MKKAGSYLIVIAIATTMLGCSDDAATASGQTLVVESYLYVGHPFKVVVSNLTGTSSVDVDHLALAISHGDEDEIIYLDAAGDGMYVSNDNVRVTDSDGDYTLRFTNEGTEIRSLAVVPTRPQGFALSATEISIEQRTGGFPGGGGGPGSFNNNSIQLTWDNPGKEYYFPFFENIEENPELINAVLDTTGGNRPAFSFRGSPTQETNSVIRQMQFQYYGRYHVILFHVSADYAALYKEQDNSSSLNLQPPFTNVVNGMGIFTAIHSDTILLTVKKPS